MASLRHKQQNGVCEFFISKHFSSRAIFVFFSKMRYDVSLKLRFVKLAKEKFASTWSFEKEIRTLAFRGREKFDNSFYFKILGIV